MVALLLTHGGCRVPSVAFSVFVGGWCLNPLTYCKMFKGILRKASSKRSMDFKVAVPIHAILRSARLENQLAQKKTEDRLRLAREKSEERVLLLLSEFKAESAVFRSEVRASFTESKADMTALKNEVRASFIESKAEFASIRTENRRNLADFRELNKADVQTAVQGMARPLFAGMTMAGVGFAYFGFSISHPILKSG